MSDARRAELEALTGKATENLSKTPKDGIGFYLRVQACMTALVALEDVCFHMDQDPYPPLMGMLNDIARLPEIFTQVYPHIQFDKGANTSPDDDHEGTRELFQTAWTTYNPEIYDHSLKLMQDRLNASGFDKKFFPGKRCIDGGCGTGRLSVAMAMAGAQEVLAADFGDESLTYLEKIVERHKVPQVKPTKQDVTDFGNFPNASFDFVASHGVLHHTPHPDRGIREHFRVTKPGGKLWLYLYGAGGIYWPIYDSLRNLLLGIAPKKIRAALSSFGLRQGLIYTFLDNFLAPRVYYSLQQTLDLLNKEGDFTWVHMQGPSPVDDTAKLLATKWGKELWGPDGEVRIVVTKV